MRGPTDISPTVTMVFWAQQVWTSNMGWQSEENIFIALQDLSVKSPRLADTGKGQRSTGIKSEEIGISWQMGCWWEGRGGRGKRLLLCQLIFDLVKLPGDFKGEDAQCSFVLSTATLTCIYSRTKLVCTKLQLVPVYRPFKNWQANCWNVFKRLSLKLCTLYPCCKELTWILLLMKWRVVILILIFHFWC